MSFLRWVAVLAVGVGIGCSNETKFSEVSPQTGTFTGGEEVELKGNAFPRSGVTVRFGSKQATGVVVQSDHTIRATTPPGEKGTTADVTLMFDDGRAFILKNAFRYVDTTQQRDTMDKFFNKASGEKKQ